MRAVAVIILLIAPVANADVGSLSIGGRWMMGTEVSFVRGERPDFVGDTRQFEQLAVLLHLRGGFVSKKRDPTQRGGWWGPEVEAKVGFTGEESPALTSRDPFGASLRLGVAMRTWAFNVPLRGMLVFHFSGELGIGGARWWSDTVRLSPILGARVATSVVEGFNVELDYGLVPTVATGSPLDLDVNRLEHRAYLRVGVGELGLGVSVTLSRERTRSKDRRQRSSGGELTFGGIVEWRP